MIPLIVGSAFLLWILKLHIARLPERWELERTPKYLLVRGPYTWTRNPMYLAEMALWIGWALFYGSGAILIGLLVLWVVMNFMVVLLTSCTVNRQSRPEDTESSQGL